MCAVSLHAKTAFHRHMLGPWSDQCLYFHYLFIQQHDVSADFLSQIRAARRSGSDRTCSDKLDAAESAFARELTLCRKCSSMASFFFHFVLNIYACGACASSVRRCGQARNRTFCQLFSHTRALFSPHDESTCDAHICRQFEFQDPDNL